MGDWSDPFGALQRPAGAPILVGGSSYQNMSYGAQQQMMQQQQMQRYRLQGLRFVAEPEIPTEMEDWDEAFWIATGIVVDGTTCKSLGGKDERV